MLGENIRHYRKLNQFSQQELAQQLGVSRQRISAWENNQSQPSPEQLSALAALLHVSTEALSAVSSEEAGGNDAQLIFVPAQPANFSVSQPAVTFAPEKPVPKKKKKGKLVLLIIGIILSSLFLVGFLAIGAWLLTRQASESVDATNNTILESTPDTPLSAVDVYNLISPSVVEIYAESSLGASQGTGFFYDDKGTVITNYHVIENCQKAFITLSDGRTYSVISVLGYDADRDLAILSTGCTQSIPLSIRTDPAKTGEKVYAIGSSQGLTGTFSDGIVSAIDREVGENVFIQTTAPISQGNSGGPLVDAKGEVVGIVCSFFTSGQNLNLAIPVDAIKDISLKNPVTLEKLFPVADRKVWWISDWGFLYHAEKESYVLLFQLKDADKLPMSAGGTVKIRIVNNDNVTVYSQTHTFTSEHFETWRFEDGEKLLLATIYISPGSIAKGSTPNGTVYFEVYGEDYSFDECTDTTTELPVTQPDVTPPPTTPPHITPPPVNYTCYYSSCQNPVSNYGEFCTSHQCITAGCTKGKSDGADYCYACICKQSGCQNPHVKDHAYCTAHTCATNGCFSAKASDSDYCTDCLCDWKDCKNAHTEQSDYCSTHACPTEGCSFPKEDESAYCCVNCVCLKYGCRNPHIEEGLFCSEHTCAVDGCLDAREDDWQYCWKHACPWCGDPCVPGSSYCEKHQ